MAGSPVRGIIESRPMLRLNLFGPVRACVDGALAIDETFTRRKAKALLVLLYLERNRYIPRDELLERLWSNVEELAADSGRLKQTAHVLRRVLEGSRSRRTGWEYIVERDGSYYFNTRAPYQSDLDELEDELRRARAARQRGDAEAALGHFQRAFNELLRRALREDRLRESSALQLMEWLWRAGDPAEAVRVYIRLRDVLARRLQLEPDPRLTALYDAIRHERHTDRHSGKGFSAAS